jgi:hypothetical protein
VLAGVVGPGMILAGYSGRPPKNLTGLLSARQN